MFGQFLPTNLISTVNVVHNVCILSTFMFYAMSDTVAYLFHEYIVVLCGNCLETMNAYHLPTYITNSTFTT